MADDAQDKNSQPSGAEDENRINMNDNDQSSKDLPQQLAQKVADSGASQDAAAAAGGGEGGEGGEGRSSVEQKIQEAMSQGQESGLLSGEQAQDGNLQGKVKEAMEKGEAPGGFMSKLASGEVKNPLSNYGNSAGSTIEDKLSPVGNVMGKGLGAVGSPVGGVVDPLLGGAMRSGGAWGEAFGVGSGNMDKKNAKEAAEAEKLKEPIGGKEQTGDNPLGL